MKTRHILLLIASTFISQLCLTSCGMSEKDIKAIINSSKGKDSYRDSKSWGKVIDKDIDVTSDINSLVLNGGMDIEIIQGEQTTVTAHGNEKAIEVYDIKFDGNRLVVDKKSEFSRTPNIPSIKIKIQAPDVNDITLNGAGDIEIKNDYKINGTFSVMVNGAGDLDIKTMECENVAITVNGAGDVQAKKITCSNKAELSVNGAGDIESEIKANAISTNIAGAGDANLKVDCNNLYVSSTGAGDVVLKGKCINFHKTESAMGAINSKELQYTTKNK